MKIDMEVRISIEKIVLESLRWALEEYITGTQDLEEKNEESYWKGYLDGTKEVLEGLEEGISLSRLTTSILYDFYETNSEMNGLWDIEGDHEDCKRIIKEIDKDLEKK